MTSSDLAQWLDAHRQAADAALASSVALAASGDLDGLLLALEELRLRSYACGALSVDLARLSSH